MSFVPEITAYKINMMRTPSPPSFGIAPVSIPRKPPIVTMNFSTVESYPERFVSISYLALL